MRVCGFAQRKNTLFINSIESLSKNDKIEDKRTHECE